jgi:hypothetical protein
MQVHPGIVFRSGPGGRRAGLAAGPDVWEVVRAFVGLHARDDEAIARTSELTSLAPGQVRTAIRYYAEYPSEIDDWIRRVDEEATRAEEDWRRVRALLRG